MTINTAPILIKSFILYVNSTIIDHMKKLILCTLLGGLLASCSTPSYTLTGKLLGFNDGDTVYISMLDQRNFNSNGDIYKDILIDSCIVRNGQIYFEGRQDSTICVTLKSYKGGKLHKFTSKFFLENGNLVAKSDSINWSLTGSPHNDILQKQFDELTPYLLKMWELSEKLETDTTLTDEERRKYRQDIKEIMEKVSEIRQCYFEANLDNPVGLELFSSNILRYDLRKQKELTEHFLAKWPNDGFVAKHKERVDKQLKSIVGEKFIDYTMRTPEGKEVTLSDFVSKNKYTLVDIWASWCTPYPSVKKHLETTYQAYKDKGLEIVGVSLDTDSAKWISGIQQWGMPWPQMSDLKGWKSQAIEPYAIGSIPHLILIDQNGTIVARNIKASTLDELLEKLLK